MTDDADTIEVQEPDDDTDDELEPKDDEVEEPA